jgi:hypothetical protein
MLTIGLGEYVNWQLNINEEEEDKMPNTHEENDIMGIEFEYLSWQFSL